MHWKKRPVKDDDVAVFVTQSTLMGQLIGVFMDALEWFAETNDIAGYPFMMFGGARDKHSDSAFDAGHAFSGVYAGVV